MYHPDFSIDNTRYNSDYRPSFFTPTLVFIIQAFMIINVSFCPLSICPLGKCPTFAVKMSKASLQ